MRKYLVLILGALLLFVAACGSKDDSASNENESGDSSEEVKVIKAGSTGQSYPNGYKEGEDLVGFDVEVLETIAENLGYEVEWVLTDFSGLMGQLESKRIDTVANAVAVTDERKEKYNFSEAYSFAGVQIVTHEDNDDINNLEDVKGKTISGVLGSNNVKNLENYDTEGEIEIRTYETREGAMNDALNNRVDGYVNARSSLLAEIQKGDLPLKFVGDPILYESIAFPFAKDEKGEELLELFNKEIEKLHEDGTLTKISEKYFKEDITVTLD